MLGTTPTCSQCKISRVKCSRWNTYQIELLGRIANVSEELYWKFVSIKKGRYSVVEVAEGEGEEEQEGEGDLAEGEVVEGVEVGEVTFGADEEVAEGAETVGEDIPPLRAETPDFAVRQDSRVPLFLPSEGSSSPVYSHGSFNGFLDGLVDEEYAWRGNVLVPSRSTSPATIRDPSEISEGLLEPSFILQEGSGLLLTDRDAELASLKRELEGARKEVRLKDDELRGKFSFARMGRLLISSPRTRSEISGARSP
jgi:hypothetical protein